MMTYALLALFVVVMVFHNPILPMLYMLRLDVPGKGKIALCFLNAWFRNLLTIIPDLLAPVVVPIALLFTKWEDDRLPKLFKWWDNDVTINGDRGLGWADGKPVIPVDDIPEAYALNFYAPGHHPRSFYARWVWLGLRNRASMLSKMLGDKENYLSPLQVLWSEGDSFLWQVKDRYRLNVQIPFVGRAIKLHYGFKIGHIGGHGGPVAIGFSLKRKREA
jgi:hypothetical protein